MSKAGIPFVNFSAEADVLSHAWSPRVLERLGGGNFKVLRMDDMPYPSEMHGYTKGLLVIDGQLRLRIDNETAAALCGELHVVSTGAPHSADAGSAGMLATLDM